LVSINSSSAGINTVFVIVGLDPAIKVILDSLMTNRESIGKKELER
jgi:hypothetical protein